MGGGDRGSRDGHFAAHAPTTQAHDRHKRMTGTPETASGNRQRTRHRARQAAVQMLYQCEVGQQDIEDVVRTFWTANLPGSESAPESVRAFAEQLARSTIANVDKIDPLIAET